MREAPRATRASYVMVAALVLIWGTTFYLVKLAVAEVDPFMVAASRVWLAAAVVVPYAVLSGRQMPTGALRWLAAVAVGVFSLGLPVTLLSWAQQYVPSGIVGVYMAAIPLFVLPLAHVFSVGEKMTRRKLFGFLVGFGGVLLLIGWETLAQLGSTDGRGQLACLCAALCYAIGSIMIRNTPKTDPIALSAVALVVASLVTTPLALAAWPVPMPSLPIAAILLWVGAVATGVAMVLRVTVISTAGSVFMSVAGYFVPITALAVGALFAGEPIQTSDALACALILGGVAFAQFGGKRKN